MPSNKGSKEEDDIDTPPILALPTHETRQLSQQMARTTSTTPTLPHDLSRLSAQVSRTRRLSAFPSSSRPDAVKLTEDQAESGHKSLTILNLNGMVAKTGDFAITNSPYSDLWSGSFLGKKVGRNYLLARHIRSQQI